jgi:aryl-alcohol dehydrogenase-like predicted oxidoreductase
MSNYGGNGTKSMKISLEHSLKNLQTDYVDLFYLHWWDYTVSVAELMQSLNDLVVAGKVHYLGISDTPAWVVTKCNQYARDHGLRQFVVYQGMWNASMRDFERDIIPMCESEGMGMCPYGVLNQGRFQTEEGFKEREKSKEGRNFIPLSEHDKQVSKALETLAKKKGDGTKLLEVALAYVTQRAPYIYPIVGGRKVEHLKGSIESLRVALTEEEIDEIEGAYNFDYGFPHSFLSGILFGEHGKTRLRGASGLGDVFLTKGMGEFDWVESPKAVRPKGGLRERIKRWSRTCLSITG